MNSVRKPTTFRLKKQLENARNQFKTVNPMSLKGRNLKEEIERLEKLSQPVSKKLTGTGKTIGDKKTKTGQFVSKPKVLSESEKRKIAREKRAKQGRVKLQQRRLELQQQIKDFKRRGQVAKAKEASKKLGRSPGALGGKLTTKKKVPSVDKPVSKLGRSPGALGGKLTTKKKVPSVDKPVSKLGRSPGALGGKLTTVKPVSKKVVKQKVPPKLVTTPGRKPKPPVSKKAVKELIPTKGLQPPSVREKSKPPKGLMPPSVREKSKAKTPKKSEEGFLGFKKIKGPKDWSPGKRTYETPFGEMTFDTSEYDPKTGESGLFYTEEEKERIKLGLDEPYKSKKGGQIKKTMKKKKKSTKSSKKKRTITSKVKGNDLIAMIYD